MTRWLRLNEQGVGNECPPTRLTLRSLAVVAPSCYSELASAQAVVSSGP